MTNLDSAASAALLAITAIPQNVNAPTQVAELEIMKTQAAAGQKQGLKKLDDRRAQLAERRQQILAFNGAIATKTKALSDDEFSAQQESIANPAANTLELAQQLRLKKDELNLLTGALTWTVEVGLQDALEGVLVATHNVRKIETAQGTIDLLLSETRNQILLADAYQENGKLSFTCEKTEFLRAVAEGAQRAEDGARKELAEFRAHREKVAQVSRNQGYITRAQVKHTI